jgi:TMEM175 potassium channel family protein
MERGPRFTNRVAPRPHEAGEAKSGRIRLYLDTLTSPLRPSGGAHQRTSRLEALSDGVFAIALTLLIIDVVSVGTAVTPGVPLETHLLHEWPTLVAYLVGFLTILVCWINHHRVFHYIRHTDSGLVWVNGMQLALVSAVPLPTAVLAANFTGEGSRTAFLLYGITFWLMATSFWGLWRYVDRKGLTDPSIDPERYVGMGKIYAYAVGWTLLCLAVAAFSVYAAVAMWTVMFAVFAFPAEFAHFIYLRTARATR